MYGMVIYCDGAHYAAVSKSKRKLYQWRDLHPAYYRLSDNYRAWRLNDGTGWADGSDRAEKVIEVFPPKAIVLW